ncbi:MAG: transposase [Bdellovibrionaceae bacterium]|nr:transposase [Pseudobdellovibrionaceae bacterium]
MRTKTHKVYDVTLGRSEASLKDFVLKIPDRSNCRVILMDLCGAVRNLAHKYFKNALVVADRFHVVKLINHHFLKTWSMLDAEGRKSKGLISMMRRHEWSKFRLYINNGGSQDFCYTWFTTTKFNERNPKCPHQF